ncbi:MAG: hypothetical protein WCH83_06695 [Alphaproteobacteria bacterium]
MPLEIIRRERGTMRRLVLIFALTFFAGSVAAQPAQTEEEQLQGLRREIEELRQRSEASRAWLEGFHVGAFVGDGRFGRCEITMDFISRVPSVRVVNTLSGTVEVINRGQPSIQRFLFEEVEAGVTRRTVVSVEGPCRETTVRIMRITLCEADGQLYINCGTFLRTTHPVSVAPQAMR